MKRITKRRSLAIFLLLLMLVQLNACHFYKVGRVKDINSQYVSSKTVNSGDYVIIHQGQKYWHLSGISVDENKVKGTLEELDRIREANYLQRLSKPEKKSTHRYIRKQDKPSLPTNEIHVYIPESINTSDSEVEIPLAGIEKIEIYDEALGATVASYLGPTVGVAAVAFGIFIAIACSCPSVYVLNDEEYEFKGGVFPGAIYQSLERTDYLPLGKIRPDGDVYRLQLRNEKMETEFINYTSLELIDHPADYRVHRDKHGELFAYKKENYPVSIVSEHESDVNILKEDDSRYLQFDGVPDSKGMVSTVLDFSIPKGAETAKLVLNAKNTRWFDYTFTEFVKLFGDYYPEFSSKQAELPASEHREWMLDQGVVLKVFLEKGDKWEYVDYFEVPGSLIDKDMIMPIDLSGVIQGDIRIKLESGFNFWEIDEAVLDVSQSPEITITQAPLISVIDVAGIEYVEMLRADDSQYFQEMKQGDRVDLTFEANPVNFQTAIICVRGYYRNEVSFEGKPDYLYLKSFKKPGALSEFSFRHHQAFMQSIATNSQ